MPCLGAEESDNYLLSSDLAECIQKPAYCSREWYQQLGICLWEFRGWGSEVCEEGVREGRDEFVEVGVEKLRIFLERLELIPIVSRCAT